MTVCECHYVHIRLWIKKALSNFLPDLTFTLNYDIFVTVVNLKFTARGCQQKSTQMNHLNGMFRISQGKKTSNAINIKKEALDKRP